MEGSRLCTNCKKKQVILDEVTGNWVCEACGVEQEFENFQAHFGGVNGPEGAFVRVGQDIYCQSSDFNYKQNKVYNAQKKIETIASQLGFSSSRSAEVRLMIDEITEGEFGLGVWFNVLVGACAYVVMRKNKIPIAMREVASVIEVDLHELGRMVVRVVDFLSLDLPKFDVVSSFERAIQNCPDFAEFSRDKKDNMVKQGRFLCKLNQVKVSIEDVASELHAGIATCRKRHKELLETLVKVAQVLPWGKNVTVKNIMKNAPSVIQYMEMKSRLEKGKRRKSLQLVVERNLEEIASECLRSQVEYTSDDCRIEHDAQYYDVADRNAIVNVSHDNLDELQISLECLSNSYSKFLSETTLMKAMDDSGVDHRRKKIKTLGLHLYKNWWSGNSDLSKKLSFEQILQKDVGFNGLPPSFVAGQLACKKRQEKIRVAKIRINDIMQSPDALLVSLSLSHISLSLSGRSDSTTKEEKNSINRYQSSSKLWGPKMDVRSEAMEPESRRVQDPEGTIEGRDPSSRIKCKPASICCRPVWRSCSNSQGRFGRISSTASSKGAQKG
ncbi:hypothetical protein Syun_031096 [Stephania yunnanensis]|uniref:Transcription factor TFIIB cyclin-like domain-containing protein n=1 Tax=Stephania yunnanensis TaxID=152371 RepID=A0AAP0DZ22_9MAGN